ncbi:MAG: DNA-binding domain-containing protein [Pseudomonadota bacterium]
MKIPMHLAETESLFTSGLIPRCSATQRTRALQLMHEDGHIPPALALQIYGNNISGARIKSLAASYPACFRILGEACFNSIAHRFIEHTPSVQPDLNRHGSTFSDFLDEWTQSHEQFSDFRYLGDLARLEWLCHTAYYAEDDSPFNFRSLAKAGQGEQEALCFQLGHSVGLLQSDYPVMAIRETNLSDNEATEVQAVELPEHLVVSRPAFQIRVERIAAFTFGILAACQEGIPMGHIIHTNHDRRKMIPEILPGLIRRGWITAMAVEKTGVPGNLDA